ncbi:MAG: hypothetical protein GY820_38910 [Gammaproteobacteria bacterium]|nr:hypothetical protein [Gammaproteobacteria bacterium]
MEENTCEATFQESLPPLYEDLGTGPHEARIEFDDGLCPIGAKQDGVMQVDYNHVFLATIEGGKNPTIAIFGRDSHEDKVPSGFKYPYIPLRFGKSTVVGSSWGEPFMTEEALTEDEKEELGDYETGCELVDSYFNSQLGTVVSRGTFANNDEDFYLCNIDGTLKVIPEYMLPHEHLLSTVSLIEYSWDFKQIHQLSDLGWSIEYDEDDRYAVTARLRDTPDLGGDENITVTFYLHPPCFVGSVGYLPALKTSYTESSKYHTTRDKVDFPFVDGKLIYYVKVRVLALLEWRKRTASVTVASDLKSISHDLLLEELPVAGARDTVWDSGSGFCDIVTTTTPTAPPGIVVLEPAYCGDKVLTQEITTEECSFYHTWDTKPSPPTGDWSGYNYNVTNTLSRQRQIKFDGNLIRETSNVVSLSTSRFEEYTHPPPVPSSEYTTVYDSIQTVLLSFHVFSVMAANVFCYLTVEGEREIEYSHSSNNTTYTQTIPTVVCTVKLMLRVGTVETQLDTMDITVSNGYEPIQPWIHMIDSDHGSYSIQEPCLGPGRSGMGTFRYGQCFLDWEDPHAVPGDPSYGDLVEDIIAELEDNDIIYGSRSLYPLGTVFLPFIPSPTGNPDYFSDGVNVNASMDGSVVHFKLSTLDGTGTIDKFVVDGAIVEPSVVQGLAGMVGESDFEFKTGW